MGTPWKSMILLKEIKLSHPLPISFAVQPLDPFSWNAPLRGPWKANLQTKTGLVKPPLSRAAP